MEHINFPLLLKDDSVEDTEGGELLAKGRKPMPIGTITERGGKKFRKEANGWVPVKGEGTQKQPEAPTSQSTVSQAPKVTPVRYAPRHVVKGELKYNSGRFDIEINGKIVASTNHSREDADRLLAKKIKEAENDANAHNLPLKEYINRAIAAGGYSNSRKTSEILKRNHAHLIEMAEEQGLPVPSSAKADHPFMAGLPEELNDANQQKTNLFKSADLTKVPKKRKTEVYQMLKGANIIVASIGVKFKKSINFRADSSLKEGDHKSTRATYEGGGGPRRSIALKDITKAETSLMHEIGHAIDYAMAASSEATVTRSEEMAKDQTELGNKFREMLDLVRKSERYTNTESAKHKKYLSSPTEIFARAFEVYSLGKAKSLIVEGKLDKSFVDRYLPDIFLDPKSPRRMELLGQVRDIDAQLMKQNQALRFATDEKQSDHAYDEIVSLKAKRSDLMDQWRSPESLIIPLDKQDEYTAKITELMDFILKNDPLKKSEGDVYDPKADTLHTTKTGVKTRAHPPKILDAHFDKVPGLIDQSQYSPSAKKHLLSLYSAFAKDPDAGSLRSGTTTKAVGDFSELRIRHLHNVLNKHPDYSLEETPGGIKITAARHSQNSPEETTTWHFNGKTLKSVTKNPISGKTRMGSCNYDNLHKTRPILGISDQRRAGLSGLGRVGGSGDPEAQSHQNQGGNAGGSPGASKSSGRSPSHQEDQEIKKGQEPLTKGKKGDWQKEGYTFKYTGGNTHIVHAFDKKGNQVGEYEFAHLTDPYPHLDPLWVSTDKKHQRKGLATGAQLLAEKETGLPIRTANVQSGDGIKFSEAFSNLKKAMHPTEKDRLNNKSDNSFSTIVDHKSQMTNQPDPEYVNFLNDNKPKKGDSIRKYGGISAKAIHNVGENKYMAKPYHKKIESATRSWVKFPILGWATMATRNMLHAAGMGEQAEDVSVHEHEGKPMTVHKFAKNFKNMDQTYNRNSNWPEATQKNARKLAVLDFLSNNVDRHGGNLMLNPDSGDMLAIDHERNFQYQKKKRDVSANLFGHIKVGGEDKPIDYLPSISDRSPEDLSGWWNDHGEKIKQAVYSELEKIKDPYIKNHIKTNFDIRHDHISDYMKHDPYSLLSNDNGGVHIQKERLPRQTVDSIVKNLPQDNLKALGALDKLLAKKRPEKQANSLLDIWKSRVSSMVPEEAGKYFSSNPYHHLENHSYGASFGFLKHISETKNKPLMDEIRKHLESKTFGEYWKDRFDRAEKE